MSQLEITLLPAPQHLYTKDGSFGLRAEGLIVLDAPAAQDLFPAGTLLEMILWNKLQYNWDLHASLALPEGEHQIVLRIAPDRAPHPQGYRLHIQAAELVIEGHDPAGVYYGVCTLRQLIQQFGNKLPCLEVVDWPDIPARGVMLDISRDKVCRMETLFELVDRLSSWKINQLQLYTEHTFAYRNHPEVWRDASPLTGEEILILDRYCRERYIELVPNQNSFGHLHHWLNIERYAPLAENSGEIIVPWGIMHGPFSISPAVPESFELIKSLYDELLPHFSSKMVNIGCDETFDLGTGKSKSLCEEKGTGRVYLDFLLRLYRDIKRRGFTAQFWGDIIIMHPELVSELPQDMIALEWGYEADYPFMEHGKVFAASGIPFYVCPGTSAWNTLVGRTDNAVKNLASAAESARANGAIGYLITDWGDSGHWQPYPVSLLGFGAGACYSWGFEQNKKVDLTEVISWFGFDDPSGAMGRLAYELGNVYHLAGYEPHNSSAAFRILQMPLQELRDRSELTSEVMVAMAEGTRAALKHLDDQHMTRPDADLICSEFTLAARLVLHACNRGLFALGSDLAISAIEMQAELSALIEEYQAIWLQRNRPGGLVDSVNRLKDLLTDYK